jgi:hypothetical protein
MPHSCSLRNLDSGLAYRGGSHYSLLTYHVISGSGLRYLPVEYTSTQNCSPEEASAARNLLKGMLVNGATWVDGSGLEHILMPDDIMIITPYNA